MNNKPLTELERRGLKSHQLPIGEPSQLSDAFRAGIAWAQQHLLDGSAVPDFYVHQRSVDNVLKHSHSYAHLTNTTHNRYHPENLVPMFLAPPLRIEDHVSAKPACSGQDCQSGRADICKAGKQDGIVCAEHECDIDEGLRGQVQQDFEAAFKVEFPYNLEDKDWDFETLKRLATKKKGYVYADEFVNDLYKFFLSARRSGQPDQALLAVALESLAWADGHLSSALLKRAIEKIKKAMTPEAFKEIKPVPMNLNCPRCFGVHLDEGEWATKPHKTHQCQHCLHEWRPYDYPTVGLSVRSLKDHEATALLDNLSK